MSDDTLRPPPANAKPIAKLDLKRRPAPRSDGEESHDAPELIAEIEREQRRTALLAAQLQGARQELADARASALPPEPSKEESASSARDRRKGKQERAPTFKEWQILAFKIGGAAATVLGAATAFITVHTATTIPPKIENTEARTKAVENTNDEDHTLLIAIRDYDRALALHDECVIAQLGVALLLGSGRSLPELGQMDVRWKEQAKPPSKPPVVWETWTWQSETPCPAKPKSP